MATIDKIRFLTKKLYPTGRAWNLPDDSVFDKVHTGLAESEADAFDDAVSILDAILPDNDNFTVDDAERWEERLGMVVQSTTVSLADRKLAIKRKMNHPGTVPARQNWLYLQEQLQAAGFDVYVYENIFSGETQSPTDIIGPNDVGIAVHADECEHASDLEHGDGELGSVYEDCVANYIDQTLDAWFDIGDNFRNTFYISGPYIDQFGNVPADRRAEFRQLILRIKPVQTVGFLFINYV